MADELDLKMMRLEIGQLRAEIARLDKQKFPKSRYQLIALSVLYALLVPMIVDHWAPMLGLTGPDSGRFSSVSVEGTVRAENLSLNDESRIGVKSHGTIRTDRPEISLWSSEGGDVRIDEDKIALVGKRGKLIIELNDKGEAVMRSIPKDKK